jgi:hypothetical protein
MILRMLPYLVTLRSPAGRNEGSAGIYCLYLQGRRQEYIATLRGCAWLIRQVLDWVVGIIAPDTFTKLGTTGNTAVSLFHALSISPLHTHWDSQSSLVVSW